MNFSRLVLVSPEKIVDTSPHATVSNQSKEKANYQKNPSPKYSGSSTIIHLKYFEKFQRLCPDQMHVLPAVCYSENQSQDPEGIGPGGIGICQVNRIHQWRAGSGSLMNPETNIRVACEIIREQGANPWTDFRNGLYRRFTIAP